MCTLKSKHIGSLTIEAILLTSVLLGVFIIMLDYLFIAHNRALALADMAIVRLNMAEHLAQSTDAWTVDVNSDWRWGNIAESTKAERGFFDSLHLRLNDRDLSSKSMMTIVPARRRSLYSIDQLRVTRRGFLFASQYVLNYAVTIRSPFSGLTGAVFSRQRQLNGTLIIDDYSHLQQMHDIALVADRIENIASLNQLVKSIRGVITKWLKLAGT